METAWKAGLEDVMATRSAICQVDGEQRRLFFRGYEIGDLAAAVDVRGRHLPPLVRRAAGRDARRPSSRRGSPRRAGFRRRSRDLLEGLPRDTHPLDALRTAVSMAADPRPGHARSDPEANLRKAYRLMSLVPETVAAWQRIRTGRDTGRRRRATRVHAARLPASARRPRALAPRWRTCWTWSLILHADHELNASTFAARVGVATLADLHAAVTAAVATLKGPRHGGANEDVLAMLLEIGDPARAESVRRGAARGAGRAVEARARRSEGAHARASVIASTRSTTRGPACCAGMAKSMAEATGKADSSSRWRSASTTRCARERPCR